MTLNSHCRTIRFHLIKKYDLHTMRAPPATQKCIPVPTIMRGWGT